MSNEIEAKETPIIEFKNVSKTYTLYKSSREQFSALFYHSKKLHKHKALNDVSFKIYKGESVGIVGNNGAGKSTLLKMITGVSFPDTGDIINIEPDILVVDEALSVGDASFKKKCKNKIKDLIKSGVTVLFVSHNKDNVEEVCTRAIYLKSGTVICDGKVEDVLKVYESKNKK